MKFRKNQQPTTPETPSDINGVMDDAEIMDAIKKFHNANKVEEKLEIFGGMEDDFSIALLDLIKAFDLKKDGKVIYPGSSTHVSVAAVFGKENVIHVEPSERAYQSLEGHGYVVFRGGIEEFIPEEKYDGLIALNSYGQPSEELLDAQLKSGAFLIANNYSFWAHDLNQLPNVELVGALLPSYVHPKDERYIITADQVDVGMITASYSYYSIEPSGKMKPGTPDNHTFADRDSRFPDGLFVFRKK